MIFDELREALIKENKDFDEFIGQERVKNQLKSALISGHHVILIGPPGIGKTTLGKNIAKLLKEKEVMDCGFNCDPKDPWCPFCKSGKITKKKILKPEDRFIRIQGSPDLTYEDLIGDIDPSKAIRYGAFSIEAFKPGKIFRANNGILFFDELNRCPPKLQNALLQILEEKKATIGSYEFDLKSDFILIATMNPEDENTEPLSDVFLDRVDVIYVNYPESLEIEKKIIDKKAKQICNVDEKIKEIMIEFVRYLRTNEKLEKKPSVRASISLYERAQANALINKRDYVILEDVLESLISVLSHRIRLKPSVEYTTNVKDFIKNEFDFFIKNKKEKGDFP